MRTTPGWLVVLLIILTVISFAFGRARAQTTISTDAFAGIAAFDSTQTVGGVKLIDQGGDATVAGARIGVGHRWPAGLYIGVEAEGLFGHGRSRAVVNGETYSRELQGAVGAFARIGWQMRSGALFYARLGPQVQFLSSGQDTLVGVGLGAEVPFSGRWFARIDGTYLTGGGVEVYQTTAGVGYRW